MPAHLEKWGCLDSGTRQIRETKCDFLPQTTVPRLYRAQRGVTRPDKEPSYLTTGPFHEKEVYFAVAAAVFFLSKKAGHHRRASSVDNEG